MKAEYSRLTGCTQSLLRSWSGPAVVSASDQRDISSRTADTKSQKVAGQIETVNRHSHSVHHTRRLPSFRQWRRILLGASGEWGCYSGGAQQLHGSQYNLHSADIVTWAATIFFINCLSVIWAARLGSILVSTPPSFPDFLYAIMLRRQQLRQQCIKYYGIVIYLTNSFKFAGCRSIDIIHLNIRTDDCIEAVHKSWVNLQPALPAGNAILGSVLTLFSAAIAIGGIQFVIFIVLVSLSLCLLFLWRPIIDHGRACFGTYQWRSSHLHVH